MARREYTLPRDEEASEPKGGIRGNTKIGPVLEVATCCLHVKYGVEIRVMSLNEDNSHSWVRISHGSNKFVKNLNSSEQETSEVQLEEYALKLDASDFASRSKAIAKPQRRTPASSSTETVPIGKELGPILSHKIIRPSIIQCRSNRSIFFVIVIYLEKMTERLNSGGRAQWQKAEETRKYFNIVLTRQDKKFSISELQGHSGRNRIDPSLTDNVLFPNNFFDSIMVQYGRSSRSS